MTDGSGDGRVPAGPTRGSGAGAPGFAEPQHTDVHDRGNRLLELSQDAMVVLLNVTLLGMGFVFLWRVWQEVVVDGDLQKGLSDIIFVVITVELYRLSVHYLKYHRVDLNILVEVGVSAIIQKVILVGVDKLTMPQLIGISILLVALGAILGVHVWESRFGVSNTPPEAEAPGDSGPTTETGATADKEEMTTRA